jgi:hypothetical protein
MAGSDLVLVICFFFFFLLANLSLFTLKFDPRASVVFDQMVLQNIRENLQLPPTSHSPRILGKKSYCFSYLSSTKKKLGITGRAEATYDSTTCGY